MSESVIDTPKKRRWSLALRIAAVSAVAAIVALVCALPGFINESKQLIWGNPPSATSPAPSLVRASSSASPSVSAAPKPTVSVAPADWERYTDDFSGYTMFLPPELVGTRHLVKSSQIFWGSREGEWLRVDVSDYDTGTQLDDWRNKADDRRPSGCYPSYREIGIRSVDNYLPNTADWEFTWKPGSQLVHVLLRGAGSKTRRGYAIWWQVPADQFEARRHDMDLFFALFKPGYKALPSPEQTFDPSYRMPCA